MRSGSGCPSYAQFDEVAPASVAACGGRHEMPEPVIGAGDREQRATATTRGTGEPQQLVEHPGVSIPPRLMRGFFDRGAKLEGECVDAYQTALLPFVEQQRVHRCVVTVCELQCGDTRRIEPRPLKARVFILPRRRPSSRVDPPALRARTSLLQSVRRPCAGAHTDASRRSSLLHSDGGLPPRGCDRPGRQC